MVQNRVFQTFIKIESKDFAENTFKRWAILFSSLSRKLHLWKNSRSQVTP